MPSTSGFDRREPSSGVRHDFNFHVSPKFIVRVLGTVTALLTVAHLVFSMNYHYLEIDVPGATFLYVLFDLMGEVTIPTWYSSSLLLICALLLAVIARVNQRLKGTHVRHWYGLSVIVLLLSIDEAADIHGAVSYKLQNLFGFGGALSYPWVIPGAVAAIVVAVIYAPFLAHLPPSIRHQMLLGGGLYVFGALGMEVIEAAYDSMYDHDAAYLVMVAIEETLEMAGVIALIVAFLKHGSTLVSGLKLVVRSHEPPVGDASSL